MIQRDTAENLQGQFELDDILQEDDSGKREQGKGKRGDDGYDAEGNLMDWPQTPAGGEAGERLNQLAAEINTITEQTRGVVISAALAVGKRLIEAKGLCPEGRFGEWLAANVDYSERKAQDMMRLYEVYGRVGAIPESIAALDYSKAVALLSAPEEQREALAERAAAEDMSVRALNGEIKRLKAEKLKAQMQIEDLEGKIEGQRDEIQRMDEREQEYDRAIVDRDDQLKAAKAAIEREREAARLADAKAAAAEASAQQLRKLHSDAEDRAAASAQRASDAVNRANRTAKELAEATARIRELEEENRKQEQEQAGKREQEQGTGEVVEKIVEVVPEAIQKELEDLRRQLAEAQKPDEVASPNEPASPVERFRDFYKNRMQPTFADALELLRQVAQEDGKAAGMFAAAMTSACKRLMDSLGVSE